mgnify:CR=1 FL=1
MDFDGKTALLHQQERVGDVTLFNKNVIESRVQKFRFKLVQVGSKQALQPAVDWSLFLLCRIHAVRTKVTIFLIRFQSVIAKTDSMDE